MGSEQHDIGCVQGVWRSGVVVGEVGAGYGKEQCGDVQESALICRRQARRYVRVSESQG